MNFLHILLDALFVMYRLRWQLMNWSRIDLLFSYFEIFKYWASVFNFFFENSNNPCYKLEQNYYLRWKFPFLDSTPSTPSPPASMKSGGGGTANAWSFFNLFTTNLWQRLEFISFRALPCGFKRYVMSLKYFKTHIT